MKRFKRPKDTVVHLKAGELVRIKKECTDEAVERACLLILTAAADELGLTDEQACSVMVRCERYANYIEQHQARMDDLSEALLKQGITLKW